MTFLCDVIIQSVTSIVVSLIVASYLGRHRKFSVLVRTGRGIILKRSGNLHARKYNKSTKPKRTNNLDMLIYMNFVLIAGPHPYRVYNYQHQCPCDKVIEQVWSKLDLNFLRCQKYDFSLYTVRLTIYYYVNFGPKTCNQFFNESLKLPTLPQNS